jgi:hypothetical protein
MKSNCQLLFVGGAADSLLKRPPRLPGAKGPCNGERNSDSVRLHDIV